MLQGTGPIGYYLKVLKGVLLTGRFVTISSFLGLRFWVLLLGVLFLNPRSWILILEPSLLGVLFRDPRS
jgi:hypothetical protein